METHNDNPENYFANKSINLNKDACRALVEAIFEEALEDWFEAKEKLRVNKDDSEALETEFDVESFFTGKYYKLYKEFSPDLPEKPLNGLIGETTDFNEDIR